MRKQIHPYLITLLPVLGGFLLLLPGCHTANKPGGEIIKLGELLTKQETAMTRGTTEQTDHLLFVATTNDRGHPQILLYRTSKKGLLKLLASRNLKYEYRLRNQAFPDQDDPEPRPGRPPFNEMKNVLGEEKTDVSFLNPEEPVLVNRLATAFGRTGSEGGVFYVVGEDPDGRQNLLAYRVTEDQQLSLVAVRSMEYDRQLTNTVFGKKKNRPSLPEVLDLKAATTDRDNSKSSSEEISNNLTSEKLGVATAEISDNHDGLFVLTYGPDGRPRLLLYTVDRKNILYLMAGREITYDRKIFNVMFRSGQPHGGGFPTAKWMYKFVKEKGYLKERAKTNEGN